MDQRKKPSSLDDLDARLRAARAREEAAAGSKYQGRKGVSGIGLGFRIGVEFVSAIMVGTGIGYALDYWLGTLPLLMVLFLVLGGAAGVMNIRRTMRGMDQSVGYGAAERRAEGPGQDESA